MKESYINDKKIKRRIYAVCLKNIWKDWEGENRRTRK
jgi:hypothetical protein